MRSRHLSPALLPVRMRPLLLLPLSSCSEGSLVRGMCGLDVVVSPVAGMVCRSGFARFPFSPFPRPRAGWRRFTSRVSAGGSVGQGPLVVPKLGPCVGLGVVWLQGGGSGGGCDEAGRRWRAPVAWAGSWLGAEVVRVAGDMDLWAAAPALVSGGWG